MKYRELTESEIEAYNVGYKNGSRQAVIKIIEFESPEEKKLYRQGYNAGCQDRKRHNVSTCVIGSNVSNVSNVKSYDSTIAITNAIVNNNNINTQNEDILLSGIRACKNPTLDEVLVYARQQNEMAGVGGFACSEETATEFWSYYEGIGWVVPNDAKTPILKWQPFLRKWATNPKHRDSLKKTENDNEPFHL